ncbi:MAG: COX15/CtaA family protein [Micrococcales bacterium]
MRVLEIGSKLVDSVFAAGKLRLYVWLSLVSQILIVVTGGAVRLTASGLGCPEWPLCTEDSLVTVPEMGIHGIIELGNRLLTFVLVTIAALTIVTVFRSAKKGRGLRWPAAALLAGIPAQAIIGGISVWTDLNPWVVGLHFVLSGALIAVAALLLFRTYQPPVEPVNEFRWRLSPVIAVTGWVSVLIGVMVTGAGPHSGDADSPRNGLDLELWQHFHSYPGYLLLGLALLQLALTLRAERNFFSSWRSRVSFLLVATISLQAIVGVLQARMGVPPLLVGIHMFGASVAIALLSLQWLVTSGRRFD